MSNYSTKFVLNFATDVSTSKFAKKTDLANLKSDIDKLDIEGLQKIASGLISLKIKVDKIDIDKF